MAYNFGNEQLPARAVSQNRNSGIYARTLFGQSIQENSVPAWNANGMSRPFVAFEDAKTKRRFGLTKEMLSCGFLTIAEPGGGKTNLLNMITARLLATQESGDKIIIFDTKGDYYREFGGRIPRDQRIVIGTGSEYREITSYHNLFAEIMPRGNDGKLIYTEDADENALEIAKQLFINMQSQMQPIFPAMAEQVIAGLLVYFMRTYWRGDQARLNNREFVGFAEGITNEELKGIFELEYMKDFRSCSSYISGKSNQTQGVSSYVGTILRELFIGPFAKHDPRREFSMREVIDAPGKKVVFIEYDLRRGETLEPMYGLLMDRGLSNGLGGRQTVRNNVYFIWDEMLLLPRLKHLSNGLNFGRTQGIRILCGLQNVSGLADTYEEVGARKILAAFQNIVAFRNSDYETRSFLMDRLGTNYRNISFAAQQENINVQREGHTVEDWDILSLGFGEAIVSLKGENPFFFTMPKYYS